MSSPVVPRMSSATRLALVSAAMTGLAAVAAAQTPTPIAAPSPIPSATATQTGSMTPDERRQYEQTRPQKEVPFNPADFDRFAGYYRLGGSGNFAHVYRTGDHYYLQLTGQPAVEQFPESPTEFFATVVAAQMSFVSGPDGRVTGMVIHQNGRVVSFARVSKAEFDGGSAALAERVKSNTPSPGTHDLVLSYIKDLEQGRPVNYDTMTPELAAAARQQSSQAAQLVRQQGAFESLEFERVLPNGGDMYVATFARGKLMWVIMPLTKDGKVSGMVFRPFPP